MSMSPIFCSLCCESHPPHCFWCGFEVPEKPRGWILSVARGHPIFHCPECVAEFKVITAELDSEEKQEESSPALTPVSRIHDEA